MILNYKKLEKKKLFYFWVFACSTLYLFYRLYVIIFAVHDDMLIYSIVRNGEIASRALADAKTGRISHLWNHFLLGFPFLLNKVWFYKLISYTTCLFDIASLWYFLKKNIDEDFAWMCAIAIPAFATISPNHNLFISYSFCHQLPIGFFILSLHFFLQSMKSKQKRYTMISCVLYLFSCMIYETFLMYMLVFFTASCLEQGKTMKSFWRYIADTLISILPHLLIALCYAGIYQLWQSFYPAQYNGISFYLDEPFFSMKAIFTYSMALFPMNEIAHISLTDAISFGRFLEKITFFSVAKSALVVAGFIFAVMNCGKKVHFRNCMLISFIGIFTPNILIGFSEKYVQSAKNQVISYVTSYYSYFFMMLFLCGVFCVIYRILQNTSLQKLYLLVIGGMIFLFSLTSDFVVNYWGEHYENLDRRYKNFDRAVSSQEMLDCDENWQVYAPDNIGIHAKESYNLDYLRIYDDTPAGGYVSNAEQIDWNQHIFCMRSDEDYLLMMMGEMDDMMCCKKLKVVSVLPQEFNLRLQMNSGEQMIFEHITDGTVLYCPDNKKFDMRFRGHIE